MHYGFVCATSAWAEAALDVEEEAKIRLDIARARRRRCNTESVGERHLTAGVAIVEIIVPVE